MCEPGGDVPYDREPGDEDPEFSYDKEPGDELELTRVNFEKPITIHLTNKQMKGIKKLGPLDIEECNDNR